MGVNARFFGNFIYDIFHGNTKWGFGDINVSEVGTTTTNIKITGHGMATGDYIRNYTRDETRTITYVDANNFTVDAITGQTDGDDIYKMRIRVALLKDTITLDGAAQDTLSRYDDVSSHEITGTNYVAGGMPIYWTDGLLHDLLTTPNPGGIVRLKGDDVTFSNITTLSDFKYAVIYYQHASAAASPLIGWITFTTNVSVVATDFTIQFADGFVGSIALTEENPSAPWARLWLKALKNASLQLINWGDGRIKAALMQSGWSPDQDVQEYWSDISTGELSATGNYAQVTLTGNTSNYIDVDTPNGYGGREDFVANDVIFPNLTSSHNFQWIVVYYDAATGEKPLLGYVKLATSQSATSHNVIISWDTSVVFQISLDTAADV